MEHRKSVEAPGQPKYYCSQLESGNRNQEYSLENKCSNVSKKQPELIPIKPRFCSSKTPRSYKHASDECLQPLLEDQLINSAADDQSRPQTVYRGNQDNSGDYQTIRENTIDNEADISAKTRHTPSYLAQFLI